MELENKISVKCHYDTKLRPFLGMSLDKQGQHEKNIQFGTYFHYPSVIILSFITENI